MQKFRPMLAASENITPDQFPSLKYPLYASQKLDGIRCLIREGVAVSRKLIEIPNVHIQKWVRECIVPNGLDGEIIIPDKSYNEIQSWVMTRYTPPSEFEFHVFDDFTHPEMVFEHRRPLWGEKRRFPRVHFVKQALIRSDSKLREIWNSIPDDWEGLILRDPYAPYKFGRSTVKQGWALKVKRFEESEAVIIGFEPRKHNTNEKQRDNLGLAKRSSHKANQETLETLGALICKDCKTGLVFNIGTGFTDAQRLEIWNSRFEPNCGRTITYKHQSYGAKELPRCPIFKGFRYD